jgi:hypothetical protein
VLDWSTAEELFWPRVRAGHVPVSRCACDKDLSACVKGHDDLTSMFLSTFSVHSSVTALAPVTTADMEGALKVW